MKKSIFHAILLAAVFLLGGCATIPAGIKPVAGFNAERFQGKWYEIARLDHWFERGLSNVSAQYSWNDKREVTVLNRGFDAKKGKWSQSTGKGEFVHSENIGSLKVCFIWPFWFPYNIIEVDLQNYQYALITGGRNYLWIMSRQETLDAQTIKDLVTRAKAWGFDTTKLIYVQHNSLKETP